MNEKYEKFRQIRSNIADLGNTHAVMHWDMEINMPAGGSDFRSQQISTLAGIIHDMMVSNEMGDILHSLNEQDGLTFKEKANVKESLRTYEREKKLDNAFVTKFSKTVSEAYQAWMKARGANDYKIFAPKLKEIFDLSREKAEKYGYTDHPYDALLDEYEPELTTKKVDEVFVGVKKGLAAVLDKIKDARQPDMSILAGTFDKNRQEELCRILATDMGFDWNCGRLDVSEHPFTTSFSPHDVRITTRYKETNFLESIWGVIHETGHALYEQGLPVSEYGLPSGEPVSLGIHESQSRLWENNVGKSLNYIDGYWKTFQKYFPDNFKDRSEADFFKALNKVEPNLIRTDSDEVTYHFHVLLRYEIEKGLIEGSLKVEDLEEIWNAKIKTYLGLDVPSPKMGILQDIHWSHGSVGYFPTYSLGTFYAAQFYVTANKAIPGLDEKIRNRQFSELLSWLRENIHSYGHIYNSEELCKKITGEGLNYRYFDEYIHAKFASVYGL
jgi:carboxypeptidase Taq